MEYARWSMVKVATVPGTSARRSGAIWSMAWHGEAGPGRRHVAEPAHQAPAGHEAVLPPLGAVHGRGTGALGVGTAGRLAAQLPPPGQERGVGEVVPPRGDLLGDGRHTVGGPGPLGAGQRLGGAQDEAVGPIGQRQHGDHLPRLGALEHVAQRHAGMRSAQVADRAGQVGSDDAVAARRGRTPWP